MLRILIILGLLVVYVIMQYNRLVALKNNRENAFADIDVQLKLRFDLVPNLVNTVKGYATHEQGIYDKIMQARQSYAGAKGVDEKIAASNMLDSAMKGLSLVVESNPELKANQNFIQMQGELSDIENKIAAARRFFNSSTKELNTYIETFPSNIIASMFKFTKGEFFEANEAEKENVKVEF